jgi:hypothetical protein
MCSACYVFKLRYALHALYALQQQAYYLKINQNLPASSYEWIRYNVNVAELSVSEQLAAVGLRGHSTGHWPTRI